VLASTLCAVGTCCCDDDDDGGGGAEGLVATRTTLGSVGST